MLVLAYKTPPPDALYCNAVIEMHAGCYMNTVWGENNHLRLGKKGKVFPKTQCLSCDLRICQRKD